MIPDRDISHVDQGLSLLLAQFKGRPRIQAWAKAYLRQCQLLEDAIYDVLIQRLIDNAVGVQLDTIGKIVGELRSGMNDATFKIFITARIRINRSRGNTEDVLDVVAIITTTTLRFREYRPACLYMEFLAITDRDPVLIFRELHETKAGGVKLTVIVPTSNTIAFLPMTVGGVSDPLHAAQDANTTSEISDIEFDPEIVPRSWFDGLGYRGSWFDSSMPVNISFGWASDVVSIRDPNSIPSAVITAPRVSFIDPPTGPA